MLSSFLWHFIVFTDSVSFTVLPMCKWFIWIQGIDGQNFKQIIHTSQKLICEKKTHFFISILCFIQMIQNKTQNFSCKEMPLCKMNSNFQNSKVSTQKHLPHFNYLTHCWQRLWKGHFVAWSLNGITPVTELLKLNVWLASQTRNLKRTWPRSHTPTLFPVPDTTTLPVNGALEFVLSTSPRAEWFLRFFVIMEHHEAYGKAKPLVCVFIYIHTTHTDG